MKHLKTAILILILPLPMSNCSNLELFKGKDDRASSPCPSHTQPPSSRADEFIKLPDPEPDPADILQPRDEQGPLYYRVDHYGSDECSNMSMQWTK